MLRMWSFCISGPVCVRGGRFMMILMSFFCVVISSKEALTTIVFMTFMDSSE